MVCSFSCFNRGTSQNRKEQNRTFHCSLSITSMFLSISLFDNNNKNCELVFWTNSCSVYSLTDVAFWRLSVCDWQLFSFTRKPADFHSCFSCVFLPLGMSLCARALVCVPCHCVQLHWAGGGWKWPDRGRWGKPKTRARDCPALDQPANQQHAPGSRPQRPGHHRQDTEVPFKNVNKAVSALIRMGLINLSLSNQGTVWFTGVWRGKVRCYNKK